VANDGKNAPSRGEPSTVEIEAEVLREDTAAKFYELALDAMAFKQRFPRSFSVRRPLTIPRVLESLRRMDAGATKLEPEVRKWRKRSRKLWKGLITRLAEIRANLPWIQHHMREAAKLIEPHCRTWIGIAAELTERLMADCDVEMRRECVKRVYDENQAAILRAQYLAVARVARRRRGEPVRPRSSQPQWVRDPRKIRVAMVKRKYSADAHDNNKTCAHLDLEGLKPIPEWGHSTWRGAWADKSTRRNVARYLSGIPAAAKGREKP
jgi:hypothetical protein